jgi:hypothetical protein
MFRFTEYIPIFKTKLKCGYMKIILFSCLLIVVCSCGGGGSVIEEQKNVEKCIYLFYGQYEFKSNNENIHVILRFFKENGIDGFSLRYEIGDEDYIDGMRIVEGIELSPRDRFDDNYQSQHPYFQLKPQQIKYNSSISFIVKECVNINLGRDIYYQGIENEKLNIKFLEDGSVELNYKPVSFLLERDFNISNKEKLGKVILKKTQGANECWNYNPNISYDKFTQGQQSFIYHDLEGEGWKVAGKDEMLDYVFDFSNYLNWNESINTQLGKYGNVFSFDFNNDNEMDIAGYFKEEHKSNAPICYKLFLNDGVRYNEAISINIENDELKPVYFPSKLEGKTVIEVNYVNKELTNFLYWDKLENRVEEYLTD